MKLLIHHTTQKNVFNLFEKDFVLNDTSNQLYIQCSRYIDSEIIENKYLFILIIAYYCTEKNERSYNYYQISRLGKDILINNLRKEIIELISSKLDDKQLKEYSKGYYQIINIYD